MTLKEFYVGQRVKQRDPDDGRVVYGKVKEIKEKSVLIDWDDPFWGFMKDIEHFEDEFSSIYDGVPAH